MNAFDEPKKIHRMPNPNVRLLEVTEEPNPPQGQKVFTIKITLFGDLPANLQVDPGTNDVGFKFSNPDSGHPLPARP